MGYRSSFTSRGFRSGILNSYGMEIFICVVVSLFFIVASYNRINFFVSVKHYVYLFSKPGLVLISKPFEFINNTLIFFNDFKELKNIKENLEKERTDLLKKIKKIDFLEIENFRLKKLLEIEEKNYSKKLVGRILIDSYKNNDFAFFIDLGENHGLKINDIVFNENGMIGRITEVGQFSSKVITLYDQDSVVPVVSMKTKKSFFVQGSNETLFIKHLDNSFSLNHNETVVTTKAAGYFKEGIKVGKVKKTLDKVYVEPFAKLSDSIYVYVLVFDFENDLNL